MHLPFVRDGVAVADSLRRPPVQVVDLDGPMPVLNDSLATRNTAGQLSEAGATVTNKARRPASLRYSTDLRKWESLTIPPLTSSVLKIRGREVIVELPNDSAFPTRLTVERGKRYQLDWANATRPVDLIWVR